MHPTSWTQFPVKSLEFSTAVVPVLAAVLRDTAFYGVTWVAPSSLVQPQTLFHRPLWSASAQYVISTFMERAPVLPGLDYCTNTMVRKINPHLWHHPFKWLFTFFVHSLYILIFSQKRTPPAHPPHLSGSSSGLLTRGGSSHWTTACLLMGHAGHTHQAELPGGHWWTLPVLFICTANIHWLPTPSPDLFCALGIWELTKRESSQAREPCPLLFAVVSLVNPSSRLSLWPAVRLRSAQLISCVLTFSSCQPLSCCFDSSFLPRNIALCKTSLTVLFFPSLIFEIWFTSSRAKGDVPLLPFTFSCVKTALYL